MRRAAALPKQCLQGKTALMRNPALPNMQDAGITNVDRIELASSDWVAIEHSYGVNINVLNASVPTCPETHNQNQ